MAGQNAGPIGFLITGPGGQGSRRPYPLGNALHHVERAETGRSGTVRHSGHDREGREDIRIGRGHDRCHGSAGRQPGDIDPGAIDHHVVACRDRLDDTHDGRGLAPPANLVCRLVPPPAVQRVTCLLRVDHGEAVPRGARVHSRHLGEGLPVLIAAVQHDHERHGGGQGRGQKQAVRRGPFREVEERLRETGGWRIRQTEAHCRDKQHPPPDVPHGPGHSFKNPVSMARRIGACDPTLMEDWRRRGLDTTSLSMEKPSFLPEQKLLRGGTRSIVLRNVEFLR
jgi:hypothetical protein